MRGALAALVLGFVLLAPAAQAERDVEAQAACLAKQLRKHGGPEGGRASAMKAHFECFPDDPARFSALFDGDGPLAQGWAAHLELFFAARPAAGERAWSTKAVGLLAGARWTPGATDIYSQLLKLQLAERPASLLDAASKLDDAALESFWRALYGGPAGFAPDAGVCAGREAQRACAALLALSASA